MSQYVTKEYLEIVLIERKPKTMVYSVRSIGQGNELGRILWYAHWRQYIFEPGINTVWSDGCLEQIVKFLKRLREERRKPMPELKAALLHGAKEEREGRCFL